jgi:hypothetical protein
VSRARCGILYAASQNRDRTKHGTVLAGLVPAIHVVLCALQKKDVDARDKPGHDEVCVRYDPGSAAHRFAKSYALRCVRGTPPLPSFLSVMFVVFHADD